VSPYVVRRFRPQILLRPILPLIVLVFLMTQTELPVTPTWFAVICGAILLYDMWSATLDLRVDAKGVRLGRRSAVPWDSIHEVVLSETAVEVRLKHGAPLPSGVDSAIHDPARRYATAPQLRTDVPGAERSALAAAVEGFGGVPLRNA
jgi:hypothetical protein